ncbi:MAG: N-methylhydantoinase A/acetone carboxylase, beta subunit [Solirubrobacterales bacterium]|nr:N-methylhydantoinase A/acetone carboxylase, beta subunit [Solirubrobacterales bacterium]
MTTSDYRLAVDVGGTFTDFVLSGDGVGERTYKASSTPSDPSDGVLAGLEAIAEDLGLDIEELARRIGVIVHGTTITTNALLTRTGAVTGLIATDGFRDTLLLRQGRRERQWDSKAPPPAHLVPRERIRTVGGRIDRHGREATPLSEPDVRAAASAFRGGGVEAVAVSLLFSFLNDGHERRVAEILAEELPGRFVSLSFDIAPQIRLYERTSTTVVSAHVGPILRDYLDRLRARLADVGFGGSLQVMQSNGGLASADIVTAQAVTTLLSGPAGGPVASARTVEPVDMPKAMTIDMGGTSFEASLARGAETEIRPGGELGGYAIATPMLDISTIGAGGGSIAWIDQGGMLRVGPQSAGADPGPAAYGRGGTGATVTDANLLLGYLGTDGFGGGELTLDREAAEAAVGRVAEHLGIGLIEAAAGIATTINASMTDSLRLLTVRRGFDPREFALVAAGGAGPVHAAALADDLGVPLVIVPHDASVLCASGILITDFKHHYVRTLFGKQPPPGPDDIEQVFRALEAEADAQLAAEGVDGETVRFRRLAEVRYVGQLHAIDVAFPERAAISAAVLDRLEEDFHPAHRERYGHALHGTETEILNVRLEARGRAWDDGNDGLARGRGGNGAAPPTRPAWFDGGFVETPVLDAVGLHPGAVVTGPALVELPTSTIVVPPEHELAVDPSGSYLLHRSSDSLEAVARRLRSGGTSV